MIPHASGRFLYSSFIAFLPLDLAENWFHEALYFFDRDILDKQATGTNVGG